MRSIAVQQASGQRLAQSSRRQSLVCRPCQSSRLHSNRLAQQQQQQQHLQRSTACAAAAPPANPAGPTSPQATFPPGTAPPDAKLITRSEVPPFIPRDDMMDQLYHWSLIEGGESGLRNFGAAMGVAPYYRNADSSADKVLWGFVLTIYREGNPLADLAVQFDLAESDKHEFLGMGPDGFPRPEGRVDKVLGKHFEIWKLGGSTRVDEDLRSSIRAYCTALVAALNRYYAFGSVFVDDAQ